MVGLTGGLTQGPVLVRHSNFVQLSLNAERRFLCLLENGVKATDGCRRQDDIAVLAAHVEIAQQVVHYAPNESC